jgi:hypothetical protein
MNSPALQHLSLDVVEQACQEAVQRVPSNGYPTMPEITIVWEFW